MPLNNIPSTGKWGAISQLIYENDLKMQAMIDVAKTTAAFGNDVKGGATIPIVLTGTGSELLSPPDNPQPLTGGVYNGYVKVTGLQTIKEGGFVTVASSEFVVGVGGAGKYHTPHAWVDLSSSTNAAVIGFIFATERAGQLYFSQRVVGMRASAQDLKTNISGGGFVEAEEGDKVSMWVASSLNTTATLYDLNISIKMDISDTLDAL